jgi:hypothetical protein
LPFTALFATSENAGSGVVAMGLSWCWNGCLFRGLQGLRKNACTSRGAVSRRCKQTPRCKQMPRGASLRASTSSSGLAFRLLAASALNFSVSLSPWASAFKMRSASSQQIAHKPIQMFASTPLYRKHLRTMYSSASEFRIICPGSVLPGYHGIPNLRTRL